MISFFKKNKILLGIILFSFVLRLATNFFLQGTSAPLLGDSLAYETLGKNLIQGKGYVLPGIGQTAYRLPLLPMLIAFLYKLFGMHEFIIRIFISLLDSLLVGGIFLLGKKIYSQNTGLFAGLIYAVSPFAIGECLHISTEVLFTLILFSFTSYLIFNQNKLDIKKIFFAGALLGLATMTRAASLYLIVFIIPAIFISTKNKNQALQFILCLNLGFILVCSPWIIRNSIVFDKTALGGTGSGEVLLGSYNPDVFEDGRKSGTWFYGKKTESYPVTQDEFKRDLAMKKAALGYFKKYWYKLPLHELNKLKYFWNFIPNLAEKVTWPKALLGFVFFGIFLPFFIWGLRDIKRAPLIYLWTVILYFNILALLTYGSIRMRFPINPYIYIISCNYMLVFFKQIFSKKRL
ncbi:ArnT family glycosyltransferase [Candidatus Margulisiibacteriota bacterium]